jgi:glutathione synthase/RimK-type ligase-like ATP-grasp enzyme
MMVLIGMLHYRKKPHNLKMAYACAAIAKMMSIDFIYFSYSGVDFSRKKINGWIYKDGNWTQQNFRFPDCIINRSGPKTKEQSIILKGLKNTIPFTSHSIGSKMKVYNKIKKGRLFENFLIPTFIVSRFDKILPIMKKYTRVVIKPDSGNRARSIYFIKLLEEDKVHCVNGLDETIYSFQEFKEFFIQLVSKEKYLIQPFIECKTKAGLTYDFRLHVQKNEIGKWIINIIYPRISGGQKLTSNISSGGYRGEFIPFLIEEFGDQYYDVKQLIEHFAISFATHFDTLYPNRSFDELGIDIAIDQNHRIYIFEVNWRPGSKHREFSVANNLVKYAKYLAEAQNK